MQIQPLQLARSEENYSEQKALLELQITRLDSVSLTLLHLTTINLLPVADNQDDRDKQEDEEGNGGCQQHEVVPKIDLVNEFWKRAFNQRLTNDSRRGAPLG